MERVVNAVGDTLIFPDGTSRKMTADEAACMALGVPVQVRLDSGEWTPTVGAVPVEVARCPHCLKALALDGPSLRCSMPVMPPHVSLMQLL